MNAPQVAMTLEQLGFNLKPQEASNEWRGQFTIIAGAPKCGKSTFLAQGGSKSWFIRMAPEFRDLTTYGVDCKDILDVEKEVAKLHKANSAGILTKQFESLVFDPGDKLLEFGQDRICDDAKAPSIYEVGGYGVGQRKYKSWLRAFLSDLRTLPLHVFFCFHTKDRELSEAGSDGKKYHRWCLDISDKLDSEFPKRIDNTLNVMVGYVGNMKARTLVTQGTKFIEAGSKAPCLKKLTKIDWSENDKQNYDSFRALFQ